MDPRKKISYEVVYPESGVTCFSSFPDYDKSRDEVEINPTPAKTYPYKLDPFQQKSIDCLERKESVLVSAHTSAGKTAIAEYAKSELDILVIGSHGYGNFKSAVLGSTAMHIAAECKVPLLVVRR